MFFKCCCKCISIQERTIVYFGWKTWSSFGPTFISPCSHGRIDRYTLLAAVGHVAVPGAEHGWAGIWLCSAGLWACSRIPACRAARPYCPGTEGRDRPGLTGGAGAEESCLEPAWWQYGPHGAGRGQVTQKNHEPTCVCAEHVWVWVWGSEKERVSSVIWR